MIIVMKHSNSSYNNIEHRKMDNRTTGGRNTSFIFLKNSVTVTHFLAACRRAGRCVQMAWDYATSDCYLYDVIGTPVYNTNFLMSDLKLKQDKGMFNISCFLLQYWFSKYQNSKGKYQMKNVSKYSHSRSIFNLKLKCLKYYSIL